MYPNWVVGRSTGQGLLLPVGEQELTASPTLVVSAINSVGPVYGGSTLLVRDAESGAEIRRVSRPEAIDSAVIVGRVIYFTGQNRTRTDPGLMRLDVDTGVVSAVVPLRRWPADWPAPGTRSPIVVSPSARTVGSGACGGLWNNPPHCWVDLALVSTGRVTRPVNDIPERPWLITDDTILARNDYPYRLVAYDVRTGAKRWSVPGLMSSGYVTPDGKTLVVVQRRRAATTHYALSTHVLAIDLRTGHSRSLLSVPAAAPVPQIWTEFSTGSVVTLGDVPLVDALNGGVSTASARQLELATGNLLPNPLTIHAGFVSVGPPVPVPLVLPATLPYRLAGFPAPNRVRLVTTPADCAPLATAGARQSCELVLHADWRSIAAPTDPLNTITWRAAMTRAALNGDTSICDDIRMKTWLSFPTTGAAPPPDAISSSVGPTASCRQFLWTEATLGSMDSVQIDRRPGAAAPLPTPDPQEACWWSFHNAPFPLTTCTAMVAAVLQRYPAPSPVTVISAATTTKPCANGTAACPVPPPTGTFLGTVVVGLRGGGQDDLRRVAGERRSPAGPRRTATRVGGVSPRRGCAPRSAVTFGFRLPSGVPIGAELEEPRPLRIDPHERP